MRPWSPRGPCRHRRPQTRARHAPLVQPRTREVQSAGRSVPPPWGVTAAGTPGSLVSGAAAGRPRPAPRRDPCGPPARSPPRTRAQRGPPPTPAHLRARAPRPQRPPGVRRPQARVRGGGVGHVTGRPRRRPGRGCASPAARPLVAGRPDPGPRRPPGPQRGRGEGGGGQGRGAHLARRACGGQRGAAPGVARYMKPFWKGKRHRAHKSGCCAT